MIPYVPPEQREHDARHPGLTCPRCPKQLELQDRFDRASLRLTRRGKITVSVVWVVAAVVVGWLLTDVTNALFGSGL